MLHSPGSGDSASFGKRGCCTRKILLQGRELCVPQPPAKQPEHGRRQRGSICSRPPPVPPLTPSGPCWPSRQRGQSCPTPRGTARSPLGLQSSSGSELPRCHLLQGRGSCPALAVPAGAPQTRHWHPRGAAGSSPGPAPAQPGTSCPLRAHFPSQPLYSTSAASQAELLSRCCCCFGLILQGSGSQNHPGLADQGTRFPCSPRPSPRSCFVQE